MLDLALARDQLLVLCQDQRSQRICRKSVQIGERSPLTCAEYRMNSRVLIPVRAKKVVQRILRVTPTTAAPRCAPAAANQCLPAASITAPASAKPCRSPLAARRSAHAPAASRTNTRRLHNAPFYYVVDKSRTVWAEDGTVGEDLPSRTRSSRRLASSLSRACLFNTHGPQAIGRSAAI